MNGNCHFVFGASVSTAVSLNAGKLIDLINTHTPLDTLSINEYTVTLFIMGGLIGGIFPDIDSPNSYMGKLSAPVSTIIGKISEQFGRTGCRHRGIFHDPIIYLIGLVLSFIYFPPLIGFFTGCLSHIFLDMFNPMGVPCIITKRGLHLGNIYAGGRSATIFSYALSVVALIIGFVCFYIYH